MNDSYAHVYINKIKRKERPIALNHKRAKYVYSMTETNNNHHSAKERENDMDYELRIHTDANHSNSMNYISEIKERRKQPNGSKEMIALYDEVISQLLSYLIELADEAMFSSIKAKIKAHISQSHLRKTVSALCEHILLFIDKAKYPNCKDFPSYSMIGKANDSNVKKHVHKELKLSHDSAQHHDTIDSLLKRNKSSHCKFLNEKNGVSNKMNTLTSSHLASSSKLSNANHYNDTAKSPKLQAKPSTPKNYSINLRSNHSAFNYFSNLLRRDTKSKAHQTNQPIPVNKYSKNDQHRGINLSHLRQDITLSPIKPSPLPSNHPFPNKASKEEPPSSSNLELLTKIKSSLDDNLKVMFNFSYESFLNKESERESKYSNED